MGMVFLLWLVLAAVNDFLERKCYNWVAVLGAVTALLSLVLNVETHPIEISFIDSLLGAISAFLSLLIFYGFRWMGAGDVKFATALGFWVGWKLLLPIWALSCFFSLVHGLFYKFSTVSSLNKIDELENIHRFIPYVTYLSVATILVLFFFNIQ